jgi:hypothetical protein
MKIDNDLLLLTISKGNFDEYLFLDQLFYLNQVKTIENENHYNKMFRSVEESGKAYGLELKKKIDIKNIKIREKRICYFLPSLDNDLAHIELLYAILKNSVNSGFKIYISGFTVDKNHIKSRLINDLCRNNIVEIITCEYNHKGIVEYINIMNDLEISQIIVTSIPTLIVPLIEVFGPNKITWFSMKFELDCFSKLINRISFCGTQESKHTEKNQKWLRNPPSLLQNYFKRNTDKLSDKTKLITINREEKIRNPIFLNAVSRILKNNKNAHFYWTGKNFDITIKSYFIKNNLPNRVHYLGWVDPDNIINEYDIFLDTPCLSGSVAAKAFASGMPVATFKHSYSWIDFYSEDFDSFIKKYDENHGVDLLLFETEKKYVEFVNRLINEHSFYDYISDLSIKLGEKYFMDKNKTSSIHFENICKILKKADSSTKCNFD